MLTFKNCLLNAKLVIMLLLTIGHYLWFPVFWCSCLTATCIMIEQINKI